jgi:hypothetical protein
MLHTILPPLLGLISWAVINVGGFLLMLNIGSDDLRPDAERKADAREPLKRLFPSWLI